MGDIERRWVGSSSPYAGIGERAGRIGRRPIAAPYKKLANCDLASYGG